MVYTTRIENYMRYYIVKANSPEEAAKITVKGHCDINYPEPCVATVIYEMLHEREEK